MSPEGREPCTPSPTVLTNCVGSVLAAVGLVLVYALKFPLHHGGFFCDDDTIRMPYHPDTVTVAALFCISTIPALLTIILSETATFITSYRKQTLPSADSASDPKTSQTGWKPFLLTTVLQILFLILGFALVGVLTEMFKCSMGRLRPHFLDVCQLAPGSYNCTEDQGYVLIYRCSQTDMSKMEDARKSFLSGHASISFYFLTFTVLHLGNAIPKSCLVLTSLLQVLCLGVACFIGVSRVTDNMHHPSDVVAGALLGIFFGAVMAKRIQSVKFTSGPPDLGNIQLESIKAA